VLVDMDLTITQHQGQVHVHTVHLGDRGCQASEGTLCGGLSLKCLCLTLKICVSSPL
jgi:hypothetical protein